MSEQKFCLQCDDGTLLVHGKQDLVARVGKLESTVPAVSGWHCPTCRECEFDPGEGQRFSAAVEALRIELNKQRGAALRASRKKLHLRQADAGRIFGGGVTAFSEYENGKTQPPKSTVLLFGLLDKHPELVVDVYDIAKEQFIDDVGFYTIVEIKSKKKSNSNLSEIKLVDCVILKNSIKAHSLA
ncbi:type II toxin-antitoxin system MqsA family antitoxin [Malikia spinosa]|uniref:Type II toxin-antitoxin system MqsA family antitoxin n=1 Tax=Malikia spinosa TaxID=86180 RepID=A0A2S9KJ87_9BURK|nr:type II toxin-antitoxin system MqsA family antitoxin [Malikia spinosa]PRD70484.1 type II toxin-antitoxin system MqsA family antitoxin [Malikia spinosa]